MIDNYQLAIIPPPATEEDQAALHALTSFDNLKEIEWLGAKWRLLPRVDVAALTEIIPNSFIGPSQGEEETTEDYIQRVMPGMIAAFDEMTAGNYGAIIMTRSEFLLLDEQARILYPDVFPSA